MISPPARAESIVIRMNAFAIAFIERGRVPNKLRMLRKPRNQIQIRAISPRSLVRSLRRVEVSHDADPAGRS